MFFRTVENVTRLHDVSYLYTCTCEHTLRSNDICFGQIRNYRPH